MVYWNFNRQGCCSGAFEHDCGPFRRTEQDVCPQERALKSGIAPGPAYMADMKAGGGTVGNPNVGRLGTPDVNELGMM